MEVRAAVAHAAGKPLSIETVDLEGPRAGAVLVEVGRLEPLALFGRIDGDRVIVAARQPASPKSNVKR